MKKGHHQYRKMGNHKWPMLRNMVTSLIKHERIVTTEAKAKELRSVAERMIRYAKKEDKAHGMRLAGAVVREKPALVKLMQVLGPRYAIRGGGYTRVMKLAKRRWGDGAHMAVIEYVDRPGELRSARPPSVLQKQSIDEAIKEIGKHQISEEQMAFLESEMDRMGLIVDVPAAEQNSEDLDAGGDDLEGDEQETEPIEITASEADVFTEDKSTENTDDALEAAEIVEQEEREPQVEEDGKVGGASPEEGEKSGNEK